MFYKFKTIGNHWFIMFEKDGERSFIYDDVDSLREFIMSNKDSLFISGDNYHYDNKLIVSLLKNGTLDGDVSYYDLKSYLPVSLDITQEIVRSNDVRLDNCLLNLNRRVFNYNVSDELGDVDLKNVIDELKYKLDFIKEIYSLRSDYFDWRLGLLSEFSLPIDYVSHSKGRLMEDIVGFNGKKISSIMLDKNLSKYMDEYPELRVVFDNLVKEEHGKSQILFGNTPINVSGQGLKDGMKNVVDTTGDNNYLYIDFNSFGPSMIINNGWLKDISEHPERYEQLRDRRIKLKSEKKNEQKYYKRLINSFIDCFNNKDSLGYNPNIGKSVTINGALIMYLIYLQIEKLGIDVIEVNTDGMIIKTDKDNNSKIREIVNETCKRLNMSCDVDEIKKISHKNTQSYCVEFADGSIKKIGSFGKMEDDLLQTNSKRFLSECLLNYYLNNDSDIMNSLMNIYLRNDPTYFQEIVNSYSSSPALYTYIDGELVPLTSSSNKIIAVKDEPKNKIYKLNSNGEIVPYNSKVKFELVNDGLENFDMSRLDLDYYFREVKRNIVSISGKKIALVDIDGTLVEDQDNKKILSSTLEKMKIKLSEEDFKRLDIEMNWAYLEFMSACKKEKGYGTVDNFSIFVRNRCSSLLGDNFDYVKFCKTYVKVETECAKESVKVYPGVEEGIQRLRCQGYDIAIYTNGLKAVQKAKLNHLSFVGNIVHVGDLSNSYAKSSKKGFVDKLETLKVNLDLDEVVMIGNGSSDLVPKTLNIPTYILLNGRNVEDLSKTVRTRSENGNVHIVNDMNDVAKNLVKKPIRKNI